jgi:dUTPase
MNTFPILVSHGQRMAQLIVGKIANFKIEVTEGELPPSARGTKGFGSSGIGI